MTDAVAFAVLDGDPPQIVPTVNGRSLVDLVTAYETARLLQPAGGYGGIVPAHFRFGDLTLYYLGREDRQWPQPGSAWLLGCECGEVGCWPLEARVVATGDTVVWTDFRQPQRPDRDYQGFGPFVFDRAQYDDAVRSAVESLARRSG